MAPGQSSGLKRWALMGWLTLNVFPFALAVVAIRSTRCARSDSLPAASIPPSAREEARPRAYTPDRLPMNAATDGAPDRARVSIPPPLPVSRPPADGDVALRVLAEARGALRDGHDEDAHTVVERCLALAPNNIDCARIAAMTSIRTGAFERARDEVDRCLRLEPDDTTCLASSVTLQLHDHDVESAAQRIQRLEALAPDAIDTEIAEAMLAAARGDRERSRSRMFLAAACSRGQPWACDTLARDAPEEGAGRDSRYRTVARRNLLALSDFVGIAALRHDR